MPPPPPILPSGLNEKSDKESDFPIVLSENINLEDEVIKDDLIRGVSLEARRLQRFNEDKTDLLGALIITSIVQPILQKGPLCGLVALAMALASKVSKNTDPTMADEDIVTRIFSEARRRGISKSGEMFSAHHMMELAKDFGNWNTPPILVDSREKSAKDLTLRTLLLGNLALIPYDADYNHGPANRSGHAAHWALLTGLVIFVDVPQLDLLEDKLKSSNRLNSEEMPIIFLNSGNQPENVEIISKLLDTTSDENIFVTARQGKSKLMGIWNFQEIMSSNQNLHEISPRILKEPSEFVLFPIESALCNQVVLLNP